jgi:hypothetical protein
MIQKYIPFFITYDTPQRVPSNCNSITFINNGTTVVNIENVPIQPSQSLSIEGNYNEFTDYNFNMSFSGTGQNNLVVVKKVYIQ